MSKLKENQECRQLELSYNIIMNKGKNKGKPDDKTPTTLIWGTKHRWVTQLQYLLSSPDSHFQHRVATMAAVRGSWLLLRSRSGCRVDGLGLEPVHTAASLGVQQDAHGSQVWVVQGGHLQGTPVGCAGLPCQHCQLWDCYSQCNYVCNRDKIKQNARVMKNTDLHFL